MKKIKLNKHYFKIIFKLGIILLISGISLFSFINIKKQKEYKKTFTYKLTQLGYNKNEIATIENTYQNEEINYILKQEKNNIFLNLAQEKYFIYRNFYDYLNYQKENNTENLNLIVEKVNTHTNSEYYSNSMATDTSKKELMLVNKYHYLDESYQPENLIIIPPTYAWGDYGSQQATEETYNAFLNMWTQAHEQGYYLMVNSSYRTFKEQEKIYNNYKKNYGTVYADSIAARPGYSEHQTGYTLDIFEKGYSQDNFHNSESYKWLIDNAHQYGFILRYPESKEDITGYNYESWHFRYVGKKVATYIHDNNITFDEYYTYFTE